MKKSVLYRLFGFGSIPAKFQEQILKEGVVIQDEGLSGSVRYTNYRGPGKYYGRSFRGFVGSIVLTEQHFLAFQFSTPVIGAPWADTRVNELDVSVEGEDRLVVTFDPSVFEEKTSGEVTVRFTTSKARLFMGQIDQRRG